ncbi:MAG: hypothetical protein ACPG4Z_05430, partial [Chitinophagales bacterium]
MNYIQKLSFCGLLVFLGFTTIVVAQDDIPTLTLEELEEIEKGDKPYAPSLLNDTRDIYAN